ncbi:HEXXH motif domain-containing protein [Actinophytocola xinjiangensis]|uniref:HEXXH motif domain-containing protein n=1 Tax=Actinophytocola xinjiangensis TaxID=485602 RepID=A0A7Z1AVE4_9PSEU|nr:HEXXH motif domain-containing protein [Actinophytocola xinjiangensis]OLF05581.1 HEXXH motif domain-containing protein [Actinophytocola xinjiangensis]
MPQDGAERPAFHRLSWRDLDDLARLDGNAGVLRRLRRAERSRRKLLLRALMEESAKSPRRLGPLPPLDIAWELLARVESRSPKAFDRILTHPYTGSWAGYTTRLCRNGTDGIGPLWMHLGHWHALAATAAIRAGLDFAAEVPAWNGNVILPSLGMARLATTEPFSVAVVRGDRGRFTVSDDTSSVVLPESPGLDAPGWWAVRKVRVRVGARRFTVRLDDLDPYRGLYEPIPPQRLPVAEVREWQRLIDEACQLIVTHLPGFAETMPIGLSSLVPKPQVLYRNPSASTGEAFGSAVVGRPTDGTSLASTLIHEFQHIVLGGLLHLIRLHDNDPRERFYVPWRDDPRPVSGAVQGLYAFLGVVAFWRSLAATGDRRAAFEFAYWRQQTWFALHALGGDSALTVAGQRFLDGMAERLGRWQGEPVPPDVAELADAAAKDHRAGWRVRHLRPDPADIARMAAAWTAGRPRPPAMIDASATPPTPVPDGLWSPARTDLVQLRTGGVGLPELDELWPTVPDATPADLAYASGRFADAVRGYRAELVDDPDRPTSLVGLGLALAASGPDPAARALLGCPEVVRAVHRTLRQSRTAPTPEGLAAWIGQLVPAT